MNHSQTRKCYVDCFESTKLQCCYTGKWHSAWTSLSPEIKSAAFGTAKPICNSSNLNHCHTGHKLRMMIWKTAMRDLSRKLSKVLKLILLKTGWCEELFLEVHWRFLCDQALNARSHTEGCFQHLRMIWTLFPESANDLRPRGKGRKLAWQGTWHENTKGTAQLRSFVVNISQPGQAGLKLACWLRRTSKPTY